jgi:hypothetical protein
MPNGFVCVPFHVSNLDSYYLQVIWNHIVWDYVSITKYPKPSSHLTQFQAKTCLTALIQLKTNIIMT